MKPHWTDNLGAWGYECKRRMLWWSRRVHAGEGRARTPAAARLVYFMPGLGIAAPGSARYAGADGFDRVAEWVYARSSDPGFDVKSFALGTPADRTDYGDLQRQISFLYRDNLVHFFWFIGALARRGIDPAAYLIEHHRLLPAYHSSGLFTLLYMTGCASWEDAEQLAADAECQRILRDAERVQVERDIAELRALDPERTDGITREALPLLLRRIVEFYPHVPRGPQALESVCKQTAGEVTLEDRGVLHQVLRGKLSCLCGFGPRPYVREDVDRLLAFCRAKNFPVELSVINGPDLHVIGGSALNVARAEVIARKGLAGRPPFRVSPLLLDCAPHTTRYRAGLRRYEAVVDRYIAAGKLRAPALPFVSRQGRLALSLEDVRDEVARLLLDEFDFPRIGRTAIRHGARWVLTGLSGGRSPARRVLRANWVDAALSEGALDMCFASTEASSEQSRRQREELLGALLPDALSLGACRGAGLGVQDLERLKEHWESGLAARRKLRLSERIFRRVFQACGA